MASSIIPDAKHQELNMSFTFDQQYEEKLIIDAVVDHIPYQIQILSNPDFDFQDIKNALLSKQFKIVSRSPEILKLKIAFVSFEFKNIEKITLNTLKQTIADLSDKLKEQSKKNVVLEDLVKQMRNELNMMMTKITNLSTENSDINKQKTERQKIQFELELKRLQNKLTTKFQEIESKKQDKEEYDKSWAIKEELLKKLFEYKMYIFQQRAKHQQEEMLRKMEEERVKNQKKQEAFKKLLEDQVKKMEEKSLKRMEQAMMKMEQKILKMQTQKFKKNQQEALERFESESLKRIEQERLKKLQNEGFKRKIEEEKLYFMQRDRLKKQQKRLQALEEEKAIKIKEEEQRQLKLQQERAREQLLIQQMKTKNSQYCFSSTHKHGWVNLANNNTKSIIFNQKFGVLALVDGVVLDKGSLIRFKIDSIDKCVGVGLGLRNVIKGNAYQMRSANQIGHGCFLAFSHGLLYSHTNKQHNDITQDFKFSSGEVIVVMTNGEELLWMNETSKKEFRMNVKMTGDDWSQACFCVQLYSPNKFTASSVSISK